jgi:hypothetical protein
MPDNHLDARTRIIAKEEITFEGTAEELGGGGGAGGLKRDL